MISVLCGEPSLWLRFAHAPDLMRLVVSPTGLNEDHLDVADVALKECPLTVTEIILPQTDKAVEIPERAHRIKVGKEPLAPGAQLAGVVRSDVFQIQESHIRHACD